MLKKHTYAWVDVKNTDWLATIAVGCTRKRAASLNMQLFRLKFAIFIGKSTQYQSQLKGLGKIDI